MKLLLILVASCVFTAAMVPRERRAVNDEELRPSTSKPICAPRTPCGWAFYPQVNAPIHSHTVNDYCECDKSTTCQIDENEIDSLSFIKRCRPPNSEPFNIES